MQKTPEQIYSDKFEQGKVLGWDYETCVREAEKAEHTNPETVECKECGGVAGRWEDTAGAGYQCYEIGCGWSSIDNEVE